MTATEQTRVHDSYDPRGRAAGRAPLRRAGGGPSPILVIGIAFAVGVLAAKWIDWRGHAHPR